MRQVAKVQRLRPVSHAHATPDTSDGVPAPDGLDPRVSSVLAVLRGRSVENVAQDRDIDSSLLARWVHDFLAAGSGAVTNRPNPDEARQRDRFVAAVAHELRTPLATARGWATLLHDGEVTGDQMGVAHERVRDALARLTDCVLDIELAAAVSLGRVPVEARPLLIGDLARELDGSPAVRHGSDLVVHADPQLLGRVLRDLWITAHREPEPERVDIDVVEAGSWHEVRVVREGVQISPMVLKAMFDPFAGNDDKTGVTLGLYTARALVVAQGGFLGAEGEGRRTVLLARLPRQPAVAS